MDACLMQMIEVAYEVKEYVEYIVGSEEVEPGDGYTYNTLLEPLIKNPYSDTKKVSTYIVDSYIDHYQTVFVGATLSSINAKSLNRLPELINDFVNSLISSNDLTNARMAREKAQEFYISLHKDLCDFIKLVIDNTQIDDVKVKGKVLLDYLKNDVIVYNRFFGTIYKDANGLSVYLPYSYPESYDELLWPKETKWDDLIKWM
jgi:hypothetical protein